MVVAVIRARYGYFAIGLGDGGIRSGVSARVADKDESGALEDWRKLGQLALLCQCGKSVELKRLGCCRSCYGRLGPEG